MISIGIDVGSVAAKGVVFNGKEIIAKGISPTGWSPRDAGQLLLGQLLNDSGILLEEIDVIVGTGYGRISLPFVHHKVTEITCHGRGAHFVDPSIEMILDIGGQDSKAIRINEEGAVLDFIMNDKCAAGTGRFLQVMANAMELEIDDLSIIATGANPVKINSMCTVFAESEIVGLLAEGKTKSEISAGLLQSIVQRSYSLVSKLGFSSKLFFSGGLASSQYLKEALGEKLKVQIVTSPLAQYIGALGAAVVGMEKVYQSNKKS